MLEKDMYNSWKSIMELYMMNRQHGRMILESVENDAIQVDCDVKATNIILQGLPPKVYALVSNHRIAKELWERIQLLMQGTSLTKQERECKLYDEFDKFAYKKGKTLRDFYLRFSLLLNDMNIYNVKLEQFQVNTKFLNTLPPEWSKFVTDFKLVWDLHTTNIDQLHAYLGQHEFHANEVRLMHERNSDPLALVATHQMTQSPYQTHQNSYQNSQFQLQFTIYSPPSFIPQMEYAPIINQHKQQLKFSQLDLGLTILVFKQGDDPIAAINHMMPFLSAVVTSRYPTTNNQLMNSSNPRQQATINDGRVTLQPVQRRQISFATGTSRTYTPGSSGSNSGKQRTDKVLLVQAQANGQILHEKELAFLADPGTTEVALMANLSHYGTNALAEVHNPDNVDNNMINQGVQVIPSSEQSNIMNHSETEITSDRNIIPYSQYVIELKHAAVQNFSSSAQQDALILSVIEQLKIQSKDNVSDLCEHSVKIDRLKQTLSKHSKEKESLMQTVTLLKNDFKKEESRNIDREIALENRIKQLDNIKAQQLIPKLYDGNVIKITSTIVIPDSEETLVLAEESYPTSSCRPTKVEVPKELSKVIMVNTSLKKLKHHLAGFDVAVKERTMTTAITEGSWGNIKCEHEVYELTCLWPSAATVYRRGFVQGFTAVLAVLKPERLKADKHGGQSFGTVHLAINHLKNQPSSLKKPVVNIMNTSTNKSFQVLVDPSCLQSPFNCRNELFAPCHCFQNTCQCAITELVYFVEPHDLSFIVVDRKITARGDSMMVLEILFSNLVFLVISSSEDNFAQVVISVSDVTWRTTERQWSVDIDSDLISFRIRPVNPIYEHLVTLLLLELKVNDI
ncbi:hypothetical protein Tco_0664782 [Tanacetum coccineum]